MKQWLWEVRNGWRLRPQYRGQRGWNALWACAAYRLPRRLVYHTLIRAGVTHIESGEVVPDVPFTEVLRRAY
jgi:hypothetical protein